MKRGSFNVICDSSWGSSAKGAASTRLADIYNWVGNVSSCNFPNAGHTAILGGLKFVGKVVPTPLILNTRGRGLVGWVGAGSGFELHQLEKEIDETMSVVGVNLFIHPRSVVVEQRHKDAEAPGGKTSTLHISSTMSGSGAAFADKAMRSTEVKMWRDLPGTNTSWEFWDKAQAAIGSTFLHEVSQGFALSIDHGTHYPACLSGASRVMTEDGPVPLRKLVLTKSKARVWSVNVKGDLELKPIEGWYRNPLGDRVWKQILTPTSRRNKDNRYIGPTFTNDHQVLTLTGYCRVDQLRVGDRLVTGERQLDSNGYQVLLGSILGDGCTCRPLRRSSRVKLAITHSPKQRGYLEYKASLLSPSLGGKIREVVTGPNSFLAGRICGRYESAASYYLYEVAQSLNCVGPKLNLDAGKLFDQIGPLGLAVWYMDDGQYKMASNGPEVFLHTNRYTEPVLTAMITALKEKFGIVATVNRRTPKDGSFPYLRIARSSHRDWFRLVAEHIHPELRYKLPDDTDLPGFRALSAELGPPATEPVVAVQDRIDTVIPGFGVSFCLEVQDNHNFLVTHDKGFLVAKNCTFRNCTPQQAYADFGIKPDQVGDVYLNVRSFPIRVGNNFDAQGNMVGYSGDVLPDQEELTWEQIGKDAEMPEEEIRQLAERERTTVTKKIRRCFSPSWTLLAQSAKMCGATKLILNFPQYIHWSSYKLRGGAEMVPKLHPRVREYIDRMQEVTGLPVVMLGTGAEHDDFIFLG